MKRSKVKVWLGLGLVLLASPRAEAGIKDLLKGKKEKAEVGPAFVPGERWEAYFKNEEDGAMTALLQPVEKNEDHAWLGLRFTPYKGPKIRIGVMKILNQTARDEQHGYWWNELQVAVAGIEELLSTGLQNTNRFSVVERKRLDTVIGEQDLGTTGRIAVQTAAKIGNVQGVEYLIYGAINEYTPEKGKKDSSGGGGGSLLGGVGLNVGLDKNLAEVAMSFSVADSTSGEVLYQTTQRATSENRKVRLGLSYGGFSTGTGKNESSPIGYAVQSCINKAVYDLAMWLKDRTWRGSVVKVDGDKVIVNAGTNRGMTSGLRLTALSKGEVLVDPETGLTLGEDVAAIGTLVVTSVAENHATAAVVDGCNGLKAGDRVELISDGK